MTRPTHQTSVLRRLWCTVQAQLARLGTRADPEQELRRLVDDLDATLHALRAGVGRALVEERRLRYRLDELEARAGEWQARAERAVARGDDPGARDALREKRASELERAEVRRSWETQSRATDELKGSLRATRDRIGDARRYLTMLLARHDAARATRRLQRTVQAATRTPAGVAVRLEHDIRRLEAEIEAQFEIAADS